MGIKIEKISVKNCGPISSFNQDLNFLNLIYSKNEGGKSFLVEFIIRCLFKSKKNWGYLRELGMGKVTISGLEDKIIDFRISKGNKLENYFEQDPRGLPSSLVKLLVVKSGETEIVKGETGVNKDIIKDFLSQRRILDSIVKKIKNTVSQAQITNEGIEIKKQGEGKEFQTKKDELNRLNEVINRFTNEYEKGELKELILKKEDFKKEEELLLKAKRYKAYRLSQAIEELEENLQNFPEDTINELNKLIREYETEERKYNDLKNELEEIKKETKRIPELEIQKNGLIKAKRFIAYEYSKKLKKQELDLNEIPEDELSRIEQSISNYNELKLKKERKLIKVNQLQNESKDYEWLKTAKENYYKYMNSMAGFSRVAYFLLIAWVIFLIFGLIMVAFEEQIFTIVSLVVATLIGSYYLMNLKKSVINFKKSEEFQSISAEFKNRFGSELKDITQLETLLSEQEKIYNQLEVHQRELENIEIEIKNLGNHIERELSRLNRDNSSEKKWDLIHSNLKKKRGKLLDDYQQIRDELAKLEVDESDYELSDPGIKYSKSKLERVAKELTTLESLQKQQKRKEDELNILENNLGKLAREIKSKFNLIFSEEIAKSDWKTHITNIEKSRNESLKQITNKQGELKGLGISEIEYLKDNPNKVFSQSELDNVREELNILDQRIKEESDRINNLKSDILPITRSDPSTDFSDLIEELYNKKEQVNREIEEIEAKIISGIVVHQTIKELQEEEDQKLIQGLNSKEVRDALIHLTGKYNELFFDGAEIIISDGYSNFLLKDLSTGAKEQVMLALRIGFLKKLLKQESAFLILDDAFQHSDYEKRPILVKTLFQLAEDGWQVIYLTMDDNIRDLFGKISQASHYKFKEISLN